MKLLPVNKYSIIREFELWFLMAEVRHQIRVDEDAQAAYFRAVAACFANPNYARMPFGTSASVEGEPDFKCHKCGKDTLVAPVDGPAVCPECCEDHDYKYERGERGHFCIHCFAKAPDDWFDP